MTATFDVEDVLSKLNVVEKVSLLAGLIPTRYTLSPSSSFLSLPLTNHNQVLTGGIPLRFPSMESQRFESRMDLMVFVEPDSSMASKQLVSPAVLLSEQLGTSTSFVKLVCSWEKRVKPRELT